jgi:hypothetical protein
MASETPERLLQIQFGPDVVNNILTMSEALFVAEMFNDHAGMFDLNHSLNTRKVTVISHSKSLSII